MTGTKRERTGSRDWYRAIEQEHLARITKEWAAKQAQDAERKAA